MRTGTDYLTGLQDDRCILLDGERVSDVTRHSTLSPAMHRIADLYDTRVKESAPWIVDDPETGSAIGFEWVVPRSAEDLALRRAAHVYWAEGSYGLMGRTPDHVASVLTGFLGSRDVFARGRDEFADNVAAFHRKARTEDLYVAYAIVPPQIDRSKPAHQQPEPFLYPGVVEERDGGIVVRGAQMIATGVVMADYLFLSYITPLQPGDEDYALSIVLPVSTPGLRIYPRRPYAATASSVFDYPLSTRLDETDSVVVLDDVLIPWDHVFVYRDVDLCRAQFFETGAHQLANFQSLVRFTTKLEFAAGLARRLAALSGADGSASVQAALGGEIAAVCAAIEALALAAEQAPDTRAGWAKPNPRHIYAGMSLQRRMVVDLMRSMRELAGGAFIAVPSSEASFDSAETGPDTDRYYRSVAASARDRVKLLKLLWDFVGTEYAGRQLQYEMFYSAAQAVVDTRLFHTFGWEHGLDLVDRCLAEYA